MDGRSRKRWVVVVVVGTVRARVGLKRTEELKVG
jgi:hypothetical protein